MPSTATDEFPALDQLNVPDEIKTAIRELCEALVREGGENIIGLILYGGLARGRFREGRSDVNLTIVLRDASLPALKKVSPALRGAWRKARIEPLLLTPVDVSKLVALFPIKALDIQSKNVVLFGQNPFAGIEVKREDIRLRIEQELLNLGLRLRRKLVSSLNSVPAMEAAMVDTARPLAIQLAWLLYLAGKPMFSGQRTETIFEEATSQFQLDGQALALMSALRDAEVSEIADMAALCDRVLMTIEKAAASAVQLR